MSIERVTIGNLRRTQSFDAGLRSAAEIDKIADAFADAILYQKDDGKRKATIDKLVGKLVTESQTTILPQAQQIGQQNALDVLNHTPNPINLNDPVERAGALLRGRARAGQRLDIIRGSVVANGSVLDASLAKYWVEPSEGDDKEKLKRLRDIHEKLETKRKDWEKATRAFHAGEISTRPAEPKLDFMSEMVSESKKAIRIQARRAGTDAEVSVFQAKGYAKFIWITPNGATACPDCRNRQNSVLTMPEWERIGRPGSGRTVCGASCFCALLPAESVASSPNIILQRHIDTPGPLTSVDDLAVLKANRIASVSAAAKQVVVASAKANLLPEPEPIRAADAATSRRIGDATPTTPVAAPSVETVKPEKPKKDAPVFSSLEDSVTVRFRGSEDERKEFDKVTKRIFGVQATPDEVASLIGMPAGSKIVVEVRHDRINLEAENNVGMGLGAERTIFKDAKGRLVIHNNEMSLLKVDQGKGIGLSVFSRQVEAARKAGVKEIACTATRGQTEYFGYSVWPKFGYDGPIPSYSLEELVKQLPNAPASIKNAKLVSDLYRTPEGRAAWEAHGNTFEATFTITPDKSSMSETVLSEYIKRKTLRPDELNAAKGSDKFAFGDSVSVTNKGGYVLVGSAKNDFGDFLSGELEAIPKDIAKKLNDKGISFIVSGKSSEALPKSLFDRYSAYVRGYPPGQNYDSAGGFYDPETKRVVTNQYVIRNGESVQNARARATVLHETGHATDFEFLDSGDKLSSQSAYKRAYSADKKAHGPLEKQQFGYYLQSGDAGREESFAEAFGIALRQKSGRGIDRDREFADAFPRVIAHVKNILGLQ